MKKIIFILLGLILISVTAQAEVKEPVNYCNDQESWAEWRELVTKFHNDDNFQAMYALRIGLCHSVMDGSLELNRAIDIFERYREALIWQTKKNQQKSEKKEGA